MRTQEKPLRVAQGREDERERGQQHWAARRPDSERGAHWLQPYRCRAGVRRLEGVDA